MKRINRNYETEFDRDFEFQDYGDVTQTHPFRLLKVESKKDKRKDKKVKGEER